MKPLSLTLRGIGPFVDSQHLDFSLLDEKALFLIHGPTGQGKSFIFDALCFALYADTPSDREGHLKSDYLENGIEPFVDFRFALGAEEYRVRRGLRYERPKKRGDGTTLQDDSHLLVKLNQNGSETVLAEKRSDVDSRIRNLMGLDAGQFRQVVMIPQGEFRRLLLADSSERESLLERLFDASLYAEVQEQLQESENRIKKEFENQQLQVERLQIDRDNICLAEKIDAGGLDLDEVDSDEADPQTRIHELLESKIKELVATAEECATDLSRVLVRQQQEKVLAEDQRKSVAIKEKRKVLENQRNAMVSLAAQLERDEKALALKDRLQEVRRSREVLKNALTESEQSRIRLDELKTQTKRHTEDESRVPGWRDERESSLKRLRLTEEFDGEYQRRTAGLSEIKEIDSILASTLVDQNTLTGKEKVLEERRFALDKILVADEEDDSRPGTFIQQRQGLSELLTLQASFSQVENDQEKLDHDLSAAGIARNAAQEDWKHLQARKEASLAGFLAATLKDGTACPVCGSTHHPVPKSGEEGQPDEAEMQAGEQAARDAETRLAELTGRREITGNHLEEISRKTKEYRERLGLKGSENLQDLIRELDERDLQLKNADAERRRLVEIEIPALEPIRQEILVRRERAGSRKDLIFRNLEMQVSRWNEILVVWKKEFSEPAPTLDEIDEHLNAWRESSEALERQLREIEMKGLRLKGELGEAETGFAGKDRHRLRSAEDCAVREKALAEGLAESDFENEEMLGTVLERAGNIDSSRRRIETWETELKDSETLLADLDERIAGKSMPDLDAIGRLCDEKRAADEAARDVLATSRASLARLEAVGKELQVLEKEGREAVVKKGVMLRLSQQVRGNIAPKISLKRFFLARRLEEVLVQATRRLSLLSKGRFILRRRDEGRTAAAQAGLDLMIADSWTGTERPVNTLSGGQLFMASLSLALGLADVVQARSGGVRLEALFIDEGFGTLDDDALQGVLKVLNDLRENRMVGVISHVPELKRQIADRIEVAAADVGSSVRLVSGS